MAQSSAESELIGIARAFTEAIGLRSLTSDFGIDIRARIHVDASAALGILERRGVGRVRPFDVGTLWLQDKQLRRVLKVVKVLGTANPAPNDEACAEGAF